jgi:hypothetical protein
MVSPAKGTGTKATGVKNAKKRKIDTYTHPKKERIKLDRAQPAGYFEEKRKTPGSTSSVADCESIVEPRGSSPDAKA